jgi:hypothetical protein
LKISGGEREIRTLDGSLPPYSLSRRAPSTTRPFLRYPVYLYTLILYSSIKKRALCNTKLIGTIFCFLISCLQFFNGLYGGGGRIRTHEAVTLNGFQDRRLQPLGHSSFVLNGAFISFCLIQVNTFHFVHYII